MCLRRLQVPAGAFIISCFDETCQIQLTGVHDRQRVDIGVIEIKRFISSVCFERRKVAEEAYVRREEEHDIY